MNFILPVSVFHHYGILCLLGGKAVPCPYVLMRATGRTRLVICGLRLNINPLMIEDTHQILDIGNSVDDRLEVALLFLVL